MPMSANDCGIHAQPFEIAIVAEAVEEILQHAPLHPVNNGAA
jgi:hypothetical protein